MRKILGIAFFVAAYIAHTTNASQYGWVAVGVLGVAFFAALTTPSGK